MKVRNFLMTFALIAAFVGLPGLLCAQFQQPTDEELKMTSDPKAPGAAAVYLYREETTNDALHFHGYYERAKILTEKGKELATVHIPYERSSFKVTNVQGRTIHADGTVIPLTVKPSDLVEAKAGKLQFNTMVFTLPSVEVGSILEYRLELRYDDNMVAEPTWHIQQPYFVRKAHYKFTPANMDGSRTISDSEGHNLSRLMYAVTGLTADNVKRSIDGTFTVDLTDIPATPQEDWMPPLNTISERVDFYYTYAHSGGDYWASEGKHWAKETERFTNPNGQLRKTAEELAGGSDTDEQKARKLYAAVMKLDNTDFSRRKSEAERKAEKIKAIKNSEDVWAQRGGSSDEIAMLYVALARAAGLKAWPMQVVDRDRAIFDAAFLNAGQLDDYIVIVELGGKEVFLDPGEKLCSFGTLHWKHALAAGIRLSDKGPVLALAPPNPYSKSIVKRVADLQIGADGSVKGVARVVMTGPDALRWRQLSLENDEDEVKKQFNEYMEGQIPDGAHADFDHFLALDDYESNLMGVVNISGNIGTATGKHFFLPGLFFESQAKHPFVAEDKRTTPIDVQFAKFDLDEVAYHLPAGFKVESLPPATDATWPTYATLKITSKPAADGVVVDRTMAYNFTVLPSTEYPSLHDFYQKVAAADQQQLVLTRGPAAAGN